MNKTDLRKVFDRIRGGDKNAFSLFYSEFKNPVYTIVYRIVQSKETAEDIVQDVFVKLFVSPPGPHVENIRAWIFQMAHNHAIDSLRKIRNTEDIEKAEATICDTADTYICKWDVEKAMSHLSFSEREVLTLRLNGELSFSHIGKIMHKSLPSVYRTYRRALKTLREYLNGGYL